MTENANRLEALSKVAEALFEKEASKQAHLTAAKKDLSGRQGRLEKMQSDALQGFCGPHPAHWHNGDVIWQAWVGQNQRNLRMEEARLRAIEEIQIPELRKAFGRREVLRNLLVKCRESPTSYR